MPSMMPNDVKPAKIKSIATTNIGELRNWFRHARGYLRYHSVNLEEQRGVYWVSGFLEGPLSKWWYSQVMQIEKKSVEDFLGHYLRSKLLHPHLRAVIVVPKWRAKPWFKQMRNFRLVDELAAAEHVFTCPTNDGIEGKRQDVGPTR
jgi:hypothetical protein